MGDVAMAVPVLRALTKQHPTMKITVLSKPFLMPLFADLKNVTFDKLKNINSDKIADLIEQILIY